MRIWIFLLIPLAVLSRGAVANDAAMAFDKIVKLCESGAEQATACEKSVWNFADVAKDDRLTVAELSRLARFFGEAFDRKLASGAVAARGLPKDMNTLPAALIFGPLSAQLLIANFDYDADGSISRQELYADLPEGKFGSFVERITRSGKQALGQASGSIFSLMAQNALGAANLPRSSARVARAPKAATALPVSPPAAQMPRSGGTKVDPGPVPPVTLGGWRAELNTTGTVPFYEIAYTLKNAAAADITRVDGVITFRDPSGTPFMSVHVAKDRGIPARGTARLRGNYPVNTTNVDHMKLRDLAPASIRAELSVQQVVIKDGTVFRF